MPRYLSGLLVLLLPWCAAAAGDPPSAKAAPPQPIADAPWVPEAGDPPLVDQLCANLGRRDPYQAGQCSVQLLGGYYQKCGWGPGGPAFNYAPFDVRYGFMLTTPCDEHGWLRGCIEALLDVNYSPVTSNFGNYVTGPSAILRYNFVQQECAVVPYLQAGAGFAITDAWRERQQDLIGGEFEFLLRGEIGARVMLTEALSLDAEVGFQHISNATIWKRNGGVNNLGFGIGLTYFFGKLE